MDRPLRLITTSPVDRLARTVEALLVVASQPLSVDELAEAANDDSERIETALRLLSERYTEGRSGIVLEHVAGGWAFRASREAAEACGRLFERPVERGLSAAALETLAIVAYLGPVSRPEIARIRGVAADSVVAGLVERGLIAESGREEGVGGAVRYRATPLFERVFGLDSLSALPRLDDLGESTDQIRERLESVAERRGAQPLFVPAGFVVPLGLETEHFRLEPLGPQHNEPDYQAWSSSVEHIHATPGWETSNWPDDRSLEDNLRDLQRHADDFENRTGFTYTVLEPTTGEVIGCVYIYPDKDEQHDAKVLSWVRASRAELDVPLWRAVSAWLADDWPFENVEYAVRGA